MEPEPYSESQAEPQSEPDMESLLAKHLEEQAQCVAKRGDVRLGRIIEISEEGALVDIGLKREGFVPIRDLRQMEEAEEQEIVAGDEVPVMVVNTRDQDGYVELSLYRARLEKDWIKAEQLLESGEIYETEITGYNRGGLTVQFGRIRGFIPLSHVVGLPRGLRDPERRDRLAAMVGQKIGLRAIEVNRNERRLIFSQRQAYRSWQRMRKRQLLEELQVGQRRHGIVSSITNFGAFVDLGGMDGLVHVSELAWRHVDDPREIVQVGDEVEVVVLEVDRSRERIGLSIKQTLEDPWDTVEERYRANQLVEGRVTRVAEIGAFIELEPGIEGLLHTSELIGSPNVTAQEVLKPGQVLPLKVLRVEPGRRRIGLSARRVQQEEWERWATERDAREAEASVEPQEEEVAELEPQGEEAAELEEPEPQGEEETIVEPEESVEPAPEPVGETEEPVAEQDTAPGTPSATAEE